MNSGQELYPSLVQMITHAENITWNRFNNFLMFNSILVLSWATVWEGQCKSPTFLVIICVLGIFGGVFWAALGYRGRKYLDAYLDMAEELETTSPLWKNSNEKYKLATKTKELHKSLHCSSWAGSKVLLTCGPLAFTALYSIMLCESVQCVV
jgi:hypothetical protein